MQTGCFELDSGDGRSVSIAGRCPDYFKGRQYKKLAPKIDFFREYKRTGDKVAYINAYRTQVLAKLDPKQIWAELGEDAILLCWEMPGEFCHRRLVALWLEESLGVKIDEVDYLGGH